MAVTIEPAAAPLPADLRTAWSKVPVSVAVDFEHDAQVDPAIRCLTRGRAPVRLFGPAFTVRCTPPDYGAVVHALDHARPGEVVVIDAGGDMRNAVIGEILGGHLRDRGCAGIVVDGAVRDIQELGGWADFPVFARGVNARGPSSKRDGVLGGPVTLGGCIVRPGDLVLGDRDGLAVLTPEIARRSLAAAQAKLAAEQEWIAALKAGRTAKEVFGL